MLSCPALTIIKPLLAMISRARYRGKFYLKQSSNQKGSRQNHTRYKPMATRSRCECCTKDCAETQNKRSMKMRRLLCKTFLTHPENFNNLKCKVETTCNPLTLSVRKPRLTIVTSNPPPPLLFHPFLLFSSSFLFFTLQLPLAFISQLPLPHIPNLMLIHLCFLISSMLILQV